MRRDLILSSKCPLPTDHPNRQFNSYLKRELQASGPVSALKRG